MFLNKLLTGPVMVAVVLSLTAVMAAAQAEGAFNLTPEAVQRIDNSVVYIHAEWRGPEGAIRDAWGTGFFIGEHEILTNYHVIADAMDRPGRRITIRTHSGTADTERYEAYVDPEATDKELDLAILTVRYAPKGGDHLEISAIEPTKNQAVLGFGFPMGDIFDSSHQGPGVALRRGYISRITEKGRTIEADMNIDHGMSGGPATNSDGFVVGIVNAMGGSSDNPSAFAFLISADTILEFLKSRGSQVVAAKPVADKPAAEDTVSAPPVGEKVLRSFFSLGKVLRVGALIGSLLQSNAEKAVEENADKEAGKEGDKQADAEAGAGIDQSLLQMARQNADSTVAYLRELKAPEELLTKGEGIRKLIEVAEDMPRLAALSKQLEDECDEWVAADIADNLEKLNYHFGAWVLEMKLGGVLIDAAKDRETCRMFVTAAEMQKTPEAVLGPLKEIQAALIEIEENRSGAGKEIISKHADSIMAVGFLGPGPADTDAGGDDDGAKG